MESARSERERSDLCLTCGLCCQGVLHDLVPLDDDELEKAARLRLPVVDSPLRLAFQLPCPRLEARRCTVYHERPRTCASYTCAVLRDYGAGDIDEATALSRIERVREQSAEVARQVAAAHPVDPRARDGAGRDAYREALRELAWMRTTWFDP